MSSLDDFEYPISFHCARPPSRMLWYLQSFCRQPAANMHPPRGPSQPGNAPWPGLVRRPPSKADHSVAPSRIRRTRNHHADAPRSILPKNNPHGPAIHQDRTTPPLSRDHRDGLAQRTDAAQSIRHVRRPSPHASPPVPGRAHVKTGGGPLAAVLEVSGRPAVGEAEAHVLHRRRPIGRLEFGVFCSRARCRVDGRRGAGGGGGAVGTSWGSSRLPYLTSP